MRVARRRRGWPAARRRSTHSGSSSPDLGLAHLDAEALRARSPVRLERGDRAQRRRRWPTAQHGRRGQPATGTTAWARQRMPLPLISAGEPSALSSSIVTSAPSVPAVTRMQAVGADAPVRRSQSATAIARRRRGGRRRGRAGRGSRCPGRGAWSGACGVQSTAAASSVHEGVRRSPVVGVEPARCGGRGGTRPAGGGRSGGCGATARSTASSSVHARRRGGRAAPCSRAPGAAVRDSPRGRSREAPDLVEEAGRQLRRRSVRRCGPRGRRVERRGRRGGTAWAGGRRARARSCENGRPLPSVTSRARTTRRRLRRLHARPAATGSSSTSRRVQRRPCPASGLELGPHLGARPGDVEVVDDRPQVQPVPPTSSARRPRASMSASAACGLALEPGDGEVLRRVEQVDEVVRHLGLLGRRSAWPCRCPCPGTPASSRPTRAPSVGSRRASARASADLPEAVVPTSTGVRDPSSQSRCGEVLGEADRDVGLASVVAVRLDAAASRPRRRAPSPPAAAMPVSSAERSV